MKNSLTYKILIVVMALSLSSCHDEFLEEKAYNSLAESSFPQSFDDLNLISNGVYARFGYYHLRYGAYEYLVHNNSIEGCAIYRGGGSQRGAGDHYTWNQNTDFRDSFIRNFYWAWEVIGQTNDLLKAMETPLEVDQAKLDRVEGEARAFKAWVYFDLVRLYGTMPVLEETPSLSNDELFVSRPKDLSVNYDFIIENLKSAIELLPTQADYIADPDLGEKGRMTKQAAQMLLAKVYLTMSGYPLNDASHLAEAKTLLEDIIASNDYELLADYTQVFSMNNELNKEIIYAIQCNPYSNAGEVFSISRMLPPNSEEQVRLTGGPQSWLAQFGVPNEFAARYKASDGGIRYEHNIVDEWVDLTTNDTINALDYGNSFVSKYYSDESYSNSVYYSPVDFPLLRFSEVLLMLSEIENELNGPSAAALTRINEVRSRAGIYEYDVADFTTKEQLRDSIFWERNMELCFEHHGVYDLRRRGWDKLRETVMSDLWYDPTLSPLNAGEFDVIKSGQFDESTMLYPIPPTYLNSNPNFSQNPGY